MITAGVVYTFSPGYAVVYIFQYVAVPIVLARCSLEFVELMSLIVGSVR